MKKSGMNRAMPPVISVRLKHLTAILLALITAVFSLSVNVFADYKETANPIISAAQNVSPSFDEYEWEERGIYLPFSAGRAITSENGKIYVLGTDNNLQNHVLCVFDKNTKLLRSIKLPAKEDEYYSGIYVSKDEIIYLLRYTLYPETVTIKSTALLCLDKNGELKISEKDEKAFPIDPYSQSCIVDDKTIATLQYSNKLVIYYNTMKEKPEPKLVRIACSDSYKNSYELQSIVDEFNDYSDEYEAELFPFEKDREYDVLMLSDGGILSGNFIRFDAKTDESIQDKSGEARLGDIYELMGDSINDDTTYMNILKADETDGKLYTLTPRYQMNIPVAYKEFVEDNGFSTWDKMISLEKKTENWLLPCYDANSVFYKLYDFVYLKNSADGTVEFDTPELRKLLEMCTLYKGGSHTSREIVDRNNSPMGPPEFVPYVPVWHTLPDGDYVEFIIKDLREQYYLTQNFDGSAPFLDSNHIDNIFTNYSAMKNILFSGADISFPGLPDLGQVILTPLYDGLKIAVPENPADADSARAFISWICTGDEIMTRYRVTPSRISMEATAAAALKTPRTHMTLTGSVVRDTVIVNSEKIEVPDVSEADVLELLSAFDGKIYVGSGELPRDGDGNYHYSEDICSISYDYFYSDKTFEELITDIERAIDWAG